MLGTREYTLCSPFRANAHNSSFVCVVGVASCRSLIIVACVCVPLIDHCNIIANKCVVYASNTTI